MGTYPDLSHFRTEDSMLAADSTLAGDSTLADRVADLTAEVEKLKQAEAKTKAAAAGRPSVTPGGRIMVDWANFLISNSLFVPPHRPVHDPSVGTKDYVRRVTFDAKGFGDLAFLLPYRP